MYQKLKQLLSAMNILTFTTFASPVILESLATLTEESLPCVGVYTPSILTQELVDLTFIGRF